MPSSGPTHCRQRAYRFVEAQLADLETTAGLVRAATGVAMHELADANAEQVEQRIEDLADRIRQRVQGESPKAMIAHGHEVLFEEAGFTGEREDYYNPHNSYLPEVLSTGRGLPILLALIYKAVMERLGLTVHGVNAPAHFMVAVEMEAPETEAQSTGEPLGDGVFMLVDPFFEGRVLSQNEAVQRIEQITGQAVPRDTAVLTTASHQQWLLRIVRNLVVALQRQHRDTDVAAMLELQSLISGDDR